MTPTCSSPWVFECVTCRAVHCMDCLRPSTAAVASLHVKTIPWRCDSNACVKAEASECGVHPDKVRGWHDQRNRVPGTDCRNVITLDNTSFDAFTAELEDPTPPNAELVDLFKK